MIHSIENIWDNGNPVGVRIECHKKNALVTVEVFARDTPGRIWDDERLNAYKDLIQASIDDRSPRSELPDDDPAKTTDPGELGYFWDGDDIVTRSTIVHGVRRLNDKLIVALGNPNG